MFAINPPVASIGRCDESAKAPFGKLNGFWTGGARYDARATALIDELLPLAAQRAGGLAWEYLFPFDGQRPPWVSSLAQGTGLQAMARAAWINYKVGRVVEGASTITQQVARNLLPDAIGTERSVRRKVREALLARNIEHRWTDPPLRCRRLPVMAFSR